MYAIITPTFKPHFAFIKKYLQSFQKYLKDPQKVRFYFVVPAEELLVLEKIIKKYDRLNISILCFEDVLRHFGITETPRFLLQKYGKFSFQTLKKLYTVLYIKERYSLIVDSESMLVRETFMEELFDNYFRNPFISGSEIQGRILSEFIQVVIRNIDKVLRTHVPFFFLENFVWFYDKSILKDMIEEYGTPMDIVKEGALESSVQAEGTVVGILEIELYHAYIWLNRNKYRYQFHNVTDVMRNTLPSTQMKEYMYNHQQRFMGNCGLVERVMTMLDCHNYEILTQMIISLNFNIIRCENVDFKSYKVQRAFLEISRPNILAASQEHPFGINSKYALLDRLASKLEKHFFKVAAPFVWIAKWVGDFLITCVCVVRITVRFIQLMLWR